MHQRSESSMYRCSESYTGVPIRYMLAFRVALYRRDVLSQYTGVPSRYTLCSELVYVGVPNRDTLRVDNGIHRCSESINTVLTKVMHQAVVVVCPVSQRGADLHLAYRDSPSRAALSGLQGFSLGPGLTAPRYDVDASC